MTIAATTRTRRNTRRHRVARTHSHGLPAASRSYVGYLYLEKAGGAVIYRSAVERDALAVLALDHAVVKIERADYSDNERIELNVGECPRATVFELPELGSYTPDLRLILDDGSVVFVEVGFHQDKVGDPDTLIRLQAAAIEAARHGAGFLILTERVMR